jgi:hypothetical protein
MCELDKRSTLIDAQKTAITALKIQVETLKARLKWATNDRDVQNLENRLAEQSRRLNESEFCLAFRAQRKGYDEWWSAQLHSPRD